MLSRPEKWDPAASQNSLRRWQVSCGLLSFLFQVKPQFKYLTEFSGGAEADFLTAACCQLSDTFNSWQGCQQMCPEKDLKEKGDRNGFSLPSFLPFFLSFLFLF